MNEMTLTYETHIFDTKQDYNVDMQSNYFPSFTLEKHKFFRLHFISWCKIQKSKAFKSQSFDNFTFICVHKPIFSFNFFFFSLCFFSVCAFFFVLNLQQYFICSQSKSWAGWMCIPYMCIVRCGYRFGRFPNEVGIYNRRAHSTFFLALKSKFLRFFFVVA